MTSQFASCGLCCAVLCCDVLCRAVLCRAVPCCAVPCRAVLCRAVQCKPKKHSQCSVAKLFAAKQILLLQSVMAYLLGFGATLRSRCILAMPIFSICGLIWRLRFVPFACNGVIFVSKCMPILNVAMSISCGVICCLSIAKVPV